MIEIPQLKWTEEIDRKWVATGPLGEFRIFGVGPHYLTECRPGEIESFKNLLECQKFIQLYLESQIYKVLAYCRLGDMS